MRIGIIADSPVLTTGFGVESYEVASALASAGHSVACFGLKGTSADENAASQLPFHVWHIDVATRWDKKLKEFFQEEKPEIVVILIDLFNLRELVTNCEAALWRGPMLVYLTPDGIPAYQDYLAPLNRAQKCVVTTHVCAEYLESCGIRVAGIAPAGVDTQVFAPLRHRDELREKAGLKTKFLVGVFGRNCERKQQPRIMEALAKIGNSVEGENVLAYFHCTKRGYWHLDEIAADLGVQDHVLFPDESMDEARGVAPLSDGLSRQPDGSIVASPRTRPHMPTNYSYVERINCCDLIVNASHCGDFEHIIIEAQACGVPLAHTNDEGIMAEAMGLGGLPLKTLDVSRGRIGQKIFMACPKSIADTILAVKQDPALRTRLKKLGTENARQYPWSRLRNMMVALVEDVRN